MIQLWTACQCLFSGLHPKCRPNLLDDLEEMLYRVPGCSIHALSSALNTGNLSFFCARVPIVL